MRTMPKHTAETVAGIRAVLPCITDADIFVSPSGDAIIDTGGTFIHVAGVHTQETSIDWQTGWEA